MPALELAKVPQALSRFDVIGTRIDNHSRFISHVGMHNENMQAIVMDDDISVIHMRPPLRRGEVIKAHVAGEFL